MSPRHRIARLGELVRWDEWHDSKLPLYLAGMCYAALRGETLGAGELLDLACLLALLCSYACFGHLVNDYSDREADRAAGKRRPLAEWSARSALAVIAAFATATLALAAARFDAGAAGLSALALLLAAAGVPGLVRTLELLEEEIRICLGLLGVTSYRELTPQHLAAAPAVTA
ncbi:MAG TPA: hypothetical protein VJN20_03195, partial [Burkholderiales bacterium]|nr:hypothetical protein [Burkholderiales bacterium]